MSFHLGISSSQLQKCCLIFRWSFSFDTVNTCPYLAPTPTLRRLIVSEINTFSCQNVERVFN